MEPGPSKTLHYKRSRFTTQLPVDYLYTPSHAWAMDRGDGVWRIGVTKFATRMLGDMVDHGFELAPDAPVQCGQIIGWLEGFKAITDIFCIADGNFLEINPVLKQKISVVNKDPYRAGWLYEVRGRTDAKCMDVQTYAQLLDKTIDRILEKEHDDEIK
jgi:glycine cleavage system H protein